MSWLLILGIGLGAGILSGIIGFGGTTIVMPILVLVFGAKAAVPIMAIAAVLGNLARIIIWWSTINWPAVGAYAVAAAPGAALGARVMIELDPVLLNIVLGGFFITLIPIRRRFNARGMRVSLIGLFSFGAVIGCLTGIVANTGPINAPLFLAYGLVKGPFIGTEAMASFFMFSSKAASFRYFGALPDEIILSGLIVGLSLMAGVWISKQFVERFDDNQFRNLIDVVLCLTGVAMIIDAFL